MKVKYCTEPKKLPTFTINALSFIKRADEQIVVRFETDAEGMTEVLEELIKRLEKFKKS